MLDCRNRGLLIGPEPVECAVNSLIELLNGHSARFEVHPKDILVLPLEFGEPVQNDTLWLGHGSDQGGLLTRDRRLQTYSYVKDDHHKSIYLLPNMDVSASATGSGASTEQRG
jgi:hypothetical protein